MICETESVVFVFNMSFRSYSTNQDHVHLTLNGEKKKTRNKKNPSCKTLPVACPNEHDPGN